MISQSTIDKIMDAAEIVDVVSDYVTLRRAGASYKGLCPFHDDTTPSFSVSPARGLCKCFSCGKGGNSVHFIMEMEQIGYLDAIRFLGKKYGIQVEEEQLTDEQRQSLNERESMFAVNEWAAKYFNETMLNNADGRAIGLAYFRSRGFRDDIIHKFKLGFCLDSFDAMLKAAKAKGYKEKYLADTGLCVKRDNGTYYDRFRGRAMFPWFNISGKVVAFGGRVLDSRTKGVSQKYVNSPDSAIYHKARELYGIYQAKKMIAKEDVVYMVEGYTDVLSMHQCGIENVVANSGTALNEAQIHLLHRFTNNIILIYDGDEAGIHAANRSTDMLLAEGMNVKMLLLPDGDDPDSFARKHTASEFKQYVEQHQTDFILFKTSLLMQQASNDPIKRANLIQDIIKSIAVIPEEIVRSTYIHECAERLSMDENILLRETNKNRAAILEELKKEAQRERERQERMASAESNRAAAQNSSEQTATIPESSPSGIPASADLPEPPHDPDIPNITDLPEYPIGQATSSLPDAPIPDAPLPDFPLADIPPADVPPTQILNPNLTSRQGAIEKRFVNLEQMIMRLVVKYGEQIIETGDGEGEEIQAEKLTLTEYVNNELKTDGLQFHSPLYSAMLNDILAHIHDENFKAERFFLHHQNVNFSREAADMVSERYHLSSNNLMAPENKMSAEYISHLMLDYKNTVIDAEIKQLKSKLTLPDIRSDAAKMLEVMQRIKNLTDIQRALAKHLGDRVMVK